MVFFLYKIASVKMTNSESVAYFLIFLSCTNVDTSSLDEQALVHLVSGFLTRASEEFDAFWFSEIPEEGRRAQIIAVNSHKMMQFNNLKVSGKASNVSV